MDGMKIDRESDALAALLLFRGMTERSRIGVEYDDSPAMAVAMEAVRKAGAVPVEIDLTAPEPDRREHAKHIGVDLVLTRDDAIYDAPAIPADLFGTFPSAPGLD